MFEKMLTKMLCYAMQNTIVMDAFFSLKMEIGYTRIVYAPMEKNR